MWYRSYFILKIEWIIFTGREDKSKRTFTKQVPYKFSFHFTRTLFFLTSSSSHNQNDEEKFFLFHSQFHPQPPPSISHAPRVQTWKKESINGINSLCYVNWYLFSIQLYRQREILFLFFLASFSSVTLNISLSLFSFMMQYFILYFFSLNIFPYIERSLFIFAYHKHVDILSWMMKFLLWKNINKFIINFHVTYAFSLSFHLN